MAFTCAIEDCLQQTHAGGEHCAMHAKRRERGSDMFAPAQERSMPIRERIQKLASNLADADSEDDAAYDRAWEALRKAVEEWSRELQARRNGLRRAAGLSPARRSEIARFAAEARADRLSPERRAAIARKAVQARILLTSKQAGGRHRVRRAGKRRGAPR